MTPFWASPCVTVYNCDSRALPLADASIDLCVTSPPYWGQRTYKGQEAALQLGHEPTMALYVEHLVGIMREVRRVLKPWATLWLNLGDVFMGSGSPGGDFRDGKGGDDYLRPYKRDDLAPLNLAGIPWRVALAMQEDGWILRQDIIWAKLSPMPEAVNGWRWEKCKAKMGHNGRGREKAKNAAVRSTPQQDHDGRDFLQDAQWQDCPGCLQCSPHGGLVLRKGNWRPTTAHEHIFLFAKSRSYFCNAEAVREPNHPDGRADVVWKAADYPNIKEHDRWPNPGGRNKRSVWTISSPNSPYEHYASFPEKLVEPCILAGTSEHGNCTACGMPWVPVVKHKLMVIARSDRNRKIGIRTGASGTMLEPHESQVVGWLPSCACQGAGSTPALVLDPFAGTGTTGVVAQRLGRRAVLADISEDYCKMMRERLEGVPLPLGVQ